MIKLCNLYEQKSVVLQVYWQKELEQLVNLKKNDGVAMSTRRNKLNSKFFHLSGQVIDFNNSLKALFLLIMLPKSWDTFRTTLSNSESIDGLSSAMVESN